MKAQQGRASLQRMVKIRIRRSYEVKKVVSIVAASVLAVSGVIALAGCQEDNGYSKEGRLAVWVGDGLQEMFETIAEDYEEATGTPVFIKSYTGLTAAEKLALDGPSGRAGDIYVQGGGADLANAVDRGLYLEVDKDAVDFDTRFVEAGQELMSYNGKAYGVPLGTETEAIYYNKTLISEEVAEGFETWDDLVTWVKDFNSKNSGKYGFQFDYTNCYYTWAFNEAFGGYIFAKNADGTYDVEDIGIDNDGSVAAMEFMKKMIDEGVTPKDMTNAVAAVEFQNGNLAMIYDGSWNLTNYRNAIGAKNLGVIKLPYIPEADKTFEDGTEGDGVPVAFGGGYGLAISAFTLNPEESMDFLDFVTSNDEYVLEYYRVIGRIPATVSCADNEEVLSDIALKGFYAQMESTTIQPPVSELAAVWTPLGSAATDIFTNNQDAEAVMVATKQAVIDAIELLG